MGRIYTPERRSWFPWHVEPSDLVEGGDPDYERALNGERQYGLLVRSSCPCGLVLGLLALRCEKKGETLIPIGICIAETPIVVDDPTPAMNMALLQRNPAREGSDDGQD